jgi:hypothetical protein
MRREKRPPSGGLFVCGVGKALARPLRLRLDKVFWVAGKGKAMSGETAFNAEAFLQKYDNVATTVVYWGPTPNVSLESIRSAAKHLNENASNGPVELHVHLTPDRIIAGVDLQAILAAAI